MGGLIMCIGRMRKNYICGLIAVILVFSLCFGSVASAETFDNGNATPINLKEPWLVTEDDGQEYMEYEIVEFGTYPQSDPSGKTKDPIKWRVMEVNGQTVLLWADSILDYRVFDPVDNGGKCWDTCELRTWLMEDFADEAFSIDEKKALSYVDHVVGYPESDDYQVVRDAVFLPDVNELYNMNYKGEKSGYVRNNRQMLYWRYATAYAHLMQIKAGGSPDGLDGYWVRTSGEQNGIYRYIKQDKYDSFNQESVWLNSSIDTCRITLGVCPMVYVSKEYLEKNLLRTDSVVVKPYTEYAPPYADNVWVEDNVDSPRYETLGDDGHTIVYDIVEMGSYPQSDKSGKVKDPIKWRVMNASETKLVLMADSILDYGQYNESQERNGIYWGSSDIRRWLNDYFYNNAFSNKEKQIILDTTHENGSKLGNSVYNGETTDKLMLPSYDDICEWMQEGKNTLTEKESMAVIWRYPTAYSYSQYKENSDSDDKGLSYWLGTSSTQDGYYMHVLEEEIEGDVRAVYGHINTCTAYLGICPVMVVNRSDEGIYYKTGEKEVTVVDEIKLPFDDQPATDDDHNAGMQESDGDISSQKTEEEAGNNTEIENGGSESAENNSEALKGDDSATETGSVESENKENNSGALKDDNSNTEIVKVVPGNTEDKQFLEDKNNNSIDSNRPVNRGDVTTTREIKNAVLGELSEQIYTGESLEPELSVKYDGVLLVKGVDYKVSFTNNINSGIAYANVTGTGQYSGTASYAFAIQPRVIDGLNTILKGKDGTIYKAEYTGDAIRPKTSFRLPIIVGTDTKRLTPQEGKDYTVSYSNNRKIGLATITYRFYGNYTGIVTKEFQIVPGKVTKLKAKKKGSSTVLTWKKVKGAAGYEISRASKKNGKYKRIARIGNKKKYVDKKSNGKKYYYKVRAYGKNSGVRYYGENVIARISK